MPSIYEGFGLPVAEAARFAKPAVVSKDGALAEIAGKGCLQVDPSDARSIASAIRQLTVSEQTLRNLANEAQRLAQRYSWRNTAIQTLSALKHAAEASPSDFPVH
jgi:glycosyltransferase involved in cell wall biosynthesis